MMSPKSKSWMPKRSMTIGGHRTSVNLEDAFWEAVKEIAKERGVTVPAVPTANWRQLTDALESVDSSLDEGSLQVDLVRLDRAVPIVGCVRRRNPRASASAQCPAAQ